MTMARNEVFWNDKTGKAFTRVAAGGAGGGRTSFIEVPASEEEYVAFLKEESDRRKYEADQSLHTHEVAVKKLADRKAEEEKVKKAAEAAHPKPAVIPNPPIPNPPINPPVYPAPGTAGRQFPVV